MRRQVTSDIAVHRPPTIAHHAAIISHSSSFFAPRIIAHHRASSRPLLRIKVPYQDLFEASAHHRASSRIIGASICAPAAHHRRINATHHAQQWQNTSDHQPRINRASIRASTAHQPQPPRASSRIIAHQLRINAHQRAPTIQQARVIAHLRASSRIIAHQSIAHPPPFCIPAHSPQAKHSRMRLTFGCKIRVINSHQRATAIKLERSSTAHHRASTAHQSITHSHHFATLRQRSPECPPRHMEPPPPHGASEAYIDAPMMRR